MSVTPARGGGRRVAARAGSARGGRSLLVALGLVTAAALSIALTGVEEPQGMAPSADQALVDRTMLVCPDDGQGPSERARVGLAAVPGLGGDGTLEVGAPGEASSVQPLARGEVADVAAGRAVVEASGEVAAGLFGTSSAAAGSTPAFGPCVAPRAAWWFAGAGGGLDHSSVLWLTNIDPGPAVVDIRVLSEDGEVDTVGTRGITVAPGETRRVSLAETAPQNDEVVVAVRASRGRVAAAMDDRFASRPGGPSGTEWLPAAQEPARTVRIAGLPSEATQRDLVLGNTSDREALVEVEVSGSRGRFVPTGAETVSVSPGAVRVLDASDLFPAGEAMAVRVSAQVPVVATVRSVDGDDLSYAGPVETLGGPAVAPVPPGDIRTTLQVTAGGGGASYRVVAHSESGEVVDEQDLRVDPAATATWRAPQEAAYVLVVPQRGSLHGAATYSGPDGISALALAPVPLRLTLPVVVPGPR